MASQRASTSALRLARPARLTSSSSRITAATSHPACSSTLQSVRYQSTQVEASTETQSTDTLAAEQLSGTAHSADPSEPIAAPRTTPERQLPKYSDEARKLKEFGRLRDIRRTKRESIDFLNTLGSTQNRNTTWRPSHARNRPVSHREVTISHLLASTAQVGHAVGSTARAFQPWVYGTRHGIAQIDLEKATMPALRKAAKVVHDVVLRDGVVLFVGTTRDTQRAVIQASRRLGGNGFHVTTQRWLPGCLTNAATLLQNAIVGSAQDYVEQYQQQKELMGEDPDDLTDLPPTTAWASKLLQPDLVVCLNTKENYFAAREATLMNIPTIGIIDTDVDPRLVTYAIPANDESVRTQELIVGVLSKAGEEGYKHRRRLLDAHERVERTKLDEEERERGIREEAEAARRARQPDNDDN